MIISKKINMIEVADWDELVEKTYGRMYNFQQQNDCRSRGIFKLTIPYKYAHEEDEEMNDSVPEEVNGEKMGVKFKVWLERDPKQPIPGQTADYELNLFWERNFYPNIYMVATDLYEKGLIEAGEYIINIDW